MVLIGLIVAYFVLLGIEKSLDAPDYPRRRSRFEKDYYEEEPQVDRTTIPGEEIIDIDHEEVK